MGSDQASLCGLWVDPEGVARLTWRFPDGTQREESRAYAPFAWARQGSSAVAADDASVEELSGAGEFDRLLRFSSMGAYRSFLAAHSREGTIDWIRQIESQFLLAERLRLFSGLRFAQLRRLQVDIETACCVEGGFSNPARKEDRVLAIGLRCGEQLEILTLDERSDAAERVLLKRFNERLAAIDPDVVEGHNLFKFDLDYLRRRLKRYRVAPVWGRYGQEARFRSARLRVAERWIDYPRCDIPGRAVVDTYLLIQIYDIGSRELMSYGLKEVARHLGVTPEDGAGRVYIDGARIQNTFDEDRQRFLDYLSDDLRETAGVAGQLLPTYFEQTKAFPTTLQEACLRGSASKVELVFQEEYFHRRSACPAPGETIAYEGGYTASFEEGVFRNVLHFDVASLYPSLLLLIGRNPARDTEGVFIPMLKRLREYRLKYKQLARSAAEPALAGEYNARQASFKILINSFYGYLGFAGARFGDAALAAEVTAKGREILQSLIAFFRSQGCQPLEADTDGIYIASEAYFAQPAVLLEKAQEILPQGIELEHDGNYVSMFCYKAKNYALYDGRRVTVRGSALRSRGIEPFVRELTWSLIRYLLGAGKEDPVQAVQEAERRLRNQELPVEQVAKSEILSQNPEAYQRKMETGGKPRRASAEVALRLKEPARMGDRVTYYIAPKAPGQTSDWQRAQPLELYDPVANPYDASYYGKRIEEWKKRYARFLPALAQDPAQGELF